MRVSTLCSSALR